MMNPIHAKGKGKCKNWCVDATSSWDVKCAWENQACSGCTECSKCANHRFCDERIVDAATAFLYCSHFIGRTMKYPDLSKNKCAYLCAQYGYKTMRNCKCDNCVTTLDQIIPKSQELSAKNECYSRHFIQLTDKSNDICHNNPLQNIKNMTISGNPGTDSLRKRCKIECLNEATCVHLIVDHNEKICYLHRSCRTRKLAAVFDTAKLDHFFLMCPDRGGCDWRYQTTALFNDTQSKHASMVMTISRAPWAPFYPVERTKTVWADFKNLHLCEPDNKDQFPNKIVLIRGTSPNESGEAPDNYLGIKPYPDFCTFADVCMEVQKANARAAFIVLQKKFTITIFDEMDNTHFQYTDNTNTSNLPNIPAGIIIHEYWNGFQQNLDENNNTFMEIGCSSSFGLANCAPVNYPNLYPGYIVCGCVIPQEIKLFNDPSQVITLEPCWQVHNKDPRYCVPDSKNCKNNRYHLKKITSPCALYCNEAEPNSCQSKECWNCPYCHNDTIFKVWNHWALWKGKMAMTTPKVTATSIVRNSGQICNNILKQYTGLWGSECKKKCQANGRCHYFSYAGGLKLCILHVNCDITMMAIQPGSYTISRLDRRYPECDWGLDGRNYCNTVYDHCGKNCECRDGYCVSFPFEQIGINKKCDDTILETQIIPNKKGKPWPQDGQSIYMSGRHCEWACLKVKNCNFFGMWHTTIWKRECKFFATCDKISEDKKNKIALYQKWTYDNHFGKCFKWFPRGGNSKCTGRHWRDPRNQWNRDTWGESKMSKKFTGANPANCLRQKAGYDEYCGFDSKWCFAPRAEDCPPDGHAVRSLEMHDEGNEGEINLSIDDEGNEGEMHDKGNEGDRKLEDSRSGQVPMQKTENENSGEDVNTPILHEY